MNSSVNVDESCS